MMVTGMLKTGMYKIVEEIAKLLKERNVKFNFNSEIVKVQSSKSNPDCAPDGCENIFILCPVPDLRYKKNWDDSEQLADTIISDLSERLNFDLQKNTITKTIMDPIDWQNNFNLYRGSGLGLAHGLNQIGGFRPKNKDEKFSNLYFVGASTTPGTGLPMVVISSKLAAERILEDSLKSKV